MASITKRKSKNGRISYRVQVRKRGHKSVNKTFRRHEDAKFWASRIESDIVSGELYRNYEARLHTFAELADRYTEEILVNKSNSTYLAQKTQLKRWCEELGSKKLSEVGADVIMLARDNIRKKYDFSETTANRHIDLLHHVLNCAVQRFRNNESGRLWMSENPLSTTQYKFSKCENQRTRFLSEEEILRLKFACRNDVIMDSVITLALQTGMRKGEIMGLKWSEVDLKNSKIFLTFTKNKEPRTIPIFGEALKVLQTASRVRRIDTNLVFPPRPGARGTLSIERKWRAVLKEADIKDFRFHDLRHTAASYLAMSGADMLTIAEILGHKSMAMVKRYTHLSDKFKSDALEKLSRKLANI